MRTIQTLISVALLSIFGATSAFAGTSAYNSYTTTNEWGARDTDINVNQVNVDASEINSQTVKFEADQGQVNSVNVSFDGSSFSGNAHSRDAGRGSDSAVVYGTSTTEQTFTTGVETVNVQTTESVTFDSHDYTHTVGSEY